MTGPRAEEGGYDYILQGYAGWMSLTGEPDGPPVKTGLSLVDMATGYAAALALMCGLWGARRDGIGCDCDISLFETAMNLNMYVSTWHLSRGYEPERLANSAHPSIVPFQNFPRRDGWIVIACPKDKFFELLCAELGLEWMIGDPRFATMAARHEHREACVDELVGGAARRAARRSWLERLRAAGVPCGPVNDMAGAVGDPQTLARDLIAETEHPVLGTVRQIRSPLRVDGRLTELRTAPQARRAHARGARRALRLCRLPTSTGSPRPASSATSRSRRRGRGRCASAAGRLTIAMPTTTTTPCRSSAALRAGDRGRPRSGSRRPAPGTPTGRRASRASA